MSMGGALTDSPMEAVAIMNYLRVQHGAWAWLAAFLTTTAAAIISICRLSNRLSPNINIINISHSRSLSQLPQQPDEVISQHKDEKDEKETLCSSNTCNTTTSSSIFTTTLSCTLEKTASGKFTLYYAHDDNIKNVSTSSSSSHDFMELDDDENHIKLTAATPGKKRLIMAGGSSSFSSKKAANEWELATLKIKTMDMGWYRHQDLSLLDGNVVRLWNQIQ
ncbi:hypothetical protein CTI12_AA189370 [Artemisia annua]|uniref:Uncharacterized protein n=1 Tax=Artemisia annua TaxID=35608 RepID=A0A2U1P6F3_ARTAN|nr:hypothetical protein CTI12_AA189370 [Artemisia annua]